MGSACAVRAIARTLARGSSLRSLAQAAAAQLRHKAMVRAMATSMMQVAINQALVAAKRLPSFSAPPAISMPSGARLSLVPYKAPMPVHRTPCWLLAAPRREASAAVQLVMQEAITSAENRVQRWQDGRVAAGVMMRELVALTEERMRERQLGIALTAQVIQRALAVAEWRLQRQRIGERLARVAIEHALVNQVVAPTMG